MSERRRIAHITLGLDVGGQEKLLLEFAKHADRSRFDLLAISLTTRGKLAEQLEALGCPVHALHSPDGLRPSIIWNLAKLLRRERVDLIHTHDDRPLIYGMPAGFLAGIRARFHTHHHGHIAQVSARQNRLSSWSARLCPTFVCVSHDSARHMQALGLRHIITLHNGIDLDRFPYQGPDRTGPIVCVARLSPEKDLATLLRAIALAVKQEPAIRLEIAGDGPCRTDLDALIQKLELQTQVRLLGPVNDVPTLLARARLFTLPSLTEGISLTILEAMARGLPVVATDVGGNGEVIVPEETGLLVPAQNPEALAQSLLRVWHDADLGHRFGLAGRDRVAQQFDVKQMVRQYEALYDPNSTRGTPTPLSDSSPEGKTRGPLATP